MTRLRLTTPTARAAVGYDPDLGSYYVEVGPPITGIDTGEDPDEGLATVRGRVPADLPRLPELLVDLDRRGIRLTLQQQQQLLAGEPVRQPARSVPYKVPLRRSSPDGSTGTAERPRQL